MSKKTTIVLKIPIIIFTIIFCIIIYSKFYSDNFDTTKNDNVINGVIDLTNINLDTKSIKLNGEWEGYNKLISPQDFSSKNINGKSSAILPNEYKDYTYGTFRVKIKLKDINKNYAIFIPFVKGSYKLWADNRLLIQTGNGNKSEEVYGVPPRIYEFMPQSQEVCITLQVNNQYNSIYVDKIYFGRAEIVNNERSKSVGMDFMTFGAGIVTSLYCFFIYNNRRKEKDLFYFALLSLGIAFRVLFLQSKCIFLFFPSLDYIEYEKIIYWLQYIMVPIILFYTDSIDYKIQGIVKKAAATSVFLYAVLILVIPYRYINYIAFSFMSLSIITLAYIILGYCKKYIKSEEWIISASAGRLKIFIDLAGLSGFTLFFMNVLTDILYRISRIETSNFDSASVFCFLIISAYIVASRQANYFNKLQDMGNKLKKSDKLKNDFLAITTHDLKNPLSGIIGLSKNLHDSNKLKYEDQKKLWMINSTAVRLLNQVDDILIFSKINSDGIELKMEKVNINKLVDLIIFMNTARKKTTIAINNKIDKNEALAYGDKDRIVQILNNIIGNALKFTSQGEINISAR